MKFDALRDYLNTLPGMGIAGYDCLVLRGGREVFRACWGYANREAGVPIGRDTLYRMYSMTKPLTCAAALQLYERGLFLLDDPLAAFLPEYAEMQVRTVTEQGIYTLRPARRPITLRHLFTMAAGLTYDLESPSLARLMQASGMRYTTREFARALAGEPLIYDPGEHWAYSLAHDVLGAVIEVISGKTLEKYMQENLFAPLGMQDAHFRVPEEKLPRCALRYCHTPAGEVTLDTPDARANIYQRSENYCSGGAGLTMTVEDYARFADAMCNRGLSRATGARILGGGTVDLMRENQLTEQQMRDFNWPQMKGYGYGLGVRTMVSRARSGSPGALGEFGWGGAAGTSLIVDPAWDAVMVFGQQSSPAEEEIIQPRLRNILYRCLED